MSSVMTWETPRESWWAQLVRAPLAGPATGATLMVALILTTHSTFRTADAEEINFDVQIAVRLCVCAVCGLYGCLYLPKTWGALTRFPGAWCLLYSVWAVVTIPFALSPTYALAACITLWCSVLFVPAALALLGGRNLAISALVAIVIYTIGSWLMYFFVPSLGRTAFVYDEIVYRLGGLSHPNDTGMLAALGVALLCMLRFAHSVRWRVFWPLVLLFAVTMYYTESRTAMIAAAVAAGICLWRSRPVLPVMAVLVAICGLLVAAILSDRGDNDVLASITRSGDSTELYDLTGRTRVWEYIAAKIQNAPMMGYGYNCARYVMIEYNAVREEAAGVYHPHNLFLNILVGMGLPGGVFFCGMVASQAIAFFRRPSVMPDIILVIVLIGGMTEVIIFYPIPGTCTLLWLMGLFWRPMHATLGRETNPLSLGNLEL